MRYFYKLLLSILLLLTFALAVMEYSAVGFSLETAYDRERDGQLQQHLLVKHAVQSALLNLGELVSDQDLESLGENVGGLIEAGDGLTLSEEGQVFYSSLAGLTLPDEPGEGQAMYRVTRGDTGAPWLLVKSRLEQSGRSLTLITGRDISAVFRQADSLRESCNRLYLGILGVCILAALGLAYALTRPLTALQAASRAFSQGDYAARANLRRKDEVGQLAAAFDQMAGVIQEKIGELEEANRRQKRFTAAFAHELKTPMTSIIGYADTIYQKDLPPEITRQAAWIIMNEGMRLEALSFKLMDLFSLEQKDFTLEVTRADELLRDAASAALPAAVKRGVELQCRPGPGWVRVEHDLFKTLLLNLIDNALKSGGTRVTLRGESRAEGYRVSVTDNGRGIPPDEIDKITEAFYMVDKSRSRKEHGAGLGLALCAGIARVHGARLEFSGAPGEGTTVSLTLREEGEAHEE